MFVARICSLIVFILAIAPANGFADTTSPQVVCQNSATGRMITRAKCKANETRFSSSAYNSRIDPVASSVTSLQGSVTSLQGNVTSLQGNVTSLQGSAASLRTDVTSLRGDVASLQGNVTTAQGDITSLQGSVDAIPQPARVLHVSASGAPYTTITSALAAASALTPTETNPVVVKVGPGSYSLSASSDTVPSFVRLEGSGIGSTNLLVTGATGLELSDSSRISRLTLRPSASNLLNFIQYSGFGSPPEVEDISIEGDLSGNSGAVSAISQSSGRLRLRRVSVDLVDFDSSAHLRGIMIFAGGRAEASNVEIRVDGSAPASLSGLFLAGGVLTISNSLIDASSSSGGQVHSIRAAGSGAQIRAFGTRALSTSQESNEVILVSTATTVLFDNCYLQSTNTSGIAGNGVVLADSGAAVDIRNSTVITSAGQTGISAYDTGSIVRVFGTFISAAAGITSDGGQVLCSSITDENYNFSGATCPS